MFAAKAGNLEVIKTLVEEGGANVNITENASHWLNVTTATYNNILIHRASVGLPFSLLMKPATMMW